MDEGRERTNRSVMRACSVLTSFSADEPRLTLKQLAERTGLPKPTAYRLAGSLQAAGFLTQGEDGRYALGFRLLGLGAVVRANLDVVRTCSAAMERLAAGTGETILLAQVDWPSRTLTIVDRLDSAHRLSIVAPVGDRTLIPPGCLGKAVLMGLPKDVRSTIIEELEWPAKARASEAAVLAELDLQSALGYATENEEYFEGVSGVGAPALYDGRWPMAALGVVGPTSRLKARLDEIGALLAAVTAELRAPGQASRNAPAPRRGRARAPGRGGAVPVPPAWCAGRPALAALA